MSYFLKPKRKNTIKNSSKIQSDKNHREMERTEDYKNKPIIVVEVLVSAQSNGGLFARFIREFIHETFISKAVKTLYAHLCSLFVPLVPPLNCLQLRPLFSLCALSCKGFSLSLHILEEPEKQFFSIQTFLSLLSSNVDT